MTRLQDLTGTDLDAFAEQLRARYAEVQAAGVKLDLTRGKPSPAQLDLCQALLETPVPAHAADGTDVRNYGGLKGLTELRAIFAELLNVDLDNIVAGDNASLSVMHDLVTQALLYGVPGGEGPWVGQPAKFICPVPGYDRHFAICQQLGIEMVPVELGEHGPDLDAVAELLTDPTVKGMWVVPTYANPNGVVYDEATTRALLQLPAAAPDFRIWWDNAYALHHLTDHEQTPLDVISLAAELGNPDRVLLFASTSKITFAGAGVSFFASSQANLQAYLDGISIRTIGPNKINQLAHAQFFGDAEGVRRLMRAHRDLLAPKFAIVNDVLEADLGPHDMATWTHPEGGYFVTVDVMEHTAGRVVELAKQAGVALTPAGASHPHGHDPQDRTIRLAPSFPNEDDLRAALAAFTTCVLLAAVEKRQAELG